MIHASKDDQEVNKQEGLILLEESKEVSSQEVQLGRQVNLSTMSQYTVPVSTEASELVQVS